MTIKIQRPRRSFIFTPGLKPEMYPKALASGADIVCVELEDGIAPKDKAEARKNALALFEKPKPMTVLKEWLGLIPCENVLELKM